MTQIKKTVGIIGLGLMGGSLGLALKNVDFIKSVHGNDHNKHHEQEALELNLVDSLLSLEDIAACDIIVLTIPVDGIISVLKLLPPLKEDTLVLDFGSTKQRIIENIPSATRKNFVASHPMTGTEKNGPSAGFASLYNNKVVALCNLDDSGSYQVELAKKIFEALNMRIITMQANDHDMHVAYISHLPHAISYALANTVLAHEDRQNILNLAATGFKDMSRLAKSSPHMWEDIFRQNKDNLLDTITQFQNELENFKQTVKKENWEALHQKMSHANNLHEIL